MTSRNFEYIFLKLTFNPRHALYVVYVFHTVSTKIFDPFLPTAMKSFMDDPFIQTRNILPPDILII